MKFQNLLGRVALVIAAVLPSVSLGSANNRALVPSMKSSAATVPSFAEQTRDAWHETVKPAACDYGVPALLGLGVGFAVGKCVRDVHGLVVNTIFTNASELEAEETALNDAVMCDKVFSLTRLRALQAQFCTTAYTLADLFGRELNAASELIHARFMEDCSSKSGDETSREMAKQVYEQFAEVSAWKHEKLKTISDLNQKKLQDKGVIIPQARELIQMLVVKDLVENCNTQEELTAFHESFCRYFSPVKLSLGEMTLKQYEDEAYRVCEEQKTYMHALLQDAQTQKKASLYDAKLGIRKYVVGYPVSAVGIVGLSAITTYCAVQSRCGSESNILADVLASPRGNSFLAGTLLGFAFHIYDVFIKGVNNVRKEWEDFTKAWGIYRGTPQEFENALENRQQELVAHYQSTLDASNKNLVLTYKKLADGKYTKDRWEARKQHALSGKTDIVNLSTNVESLQSGMQQAKENLKQLGTQLQNILTSMQAQSYVNNHAIKAPRVKSDEKSNDNNDDKELRARRSKSAGADAEITSPDLTSRLQHKGVDADGNKKDGTAVEISLVIEDENKNEDSDAQAAANTNNNDGDKNSKADKID